MGPDLQAEVTALTEYLLPATLSPEAAKRVVLRLIACAQLEEHDMITRAVNAIVADLSQFREREDKSLSQAAALSQQLLRRFLLLLKERQAGIQELLQANAAVIQEGH